MQPTNLRTHALDASDEGAELFGTDGQFLYRVTVETTERVALELAKERLGATWTLSSLDDEHSPHPGLLFQEALDVERVERKERTSR